MMKAIQIQIQIQTQWKRQQKRNRHRQSAWNTQHMLYFWNPDDSRIRNMIIDSSPSSSCSRWSPRSPCSGHRISSTGPSVSPFRDFYKLLEIYPKRNVEFILFRPDLACRCRFCQDIQGWDLPSKEIEFSFKFTSTFIQPKPITPCEIYFPIVYINRIPSELNSAIRENWMTICHW